MEDSKLAAKAEEGSRKYRPKDKRIWLGSKNQEAPPPATAPATAPAPGKLIRSGTYEKLTEGEVEEEATVTGRQTSHPYQPTRFYKWHMSKQTWAKPGDALQTLV